MFMVEGKIFMEILNDVKKTMKENHTEIKSELSDIKETLKCHQIDYASFKANTNNSINNHSDKITELETEVSEIKKEDIKEDKEKISWYKTIAFRVILAILGSSGITALILKAFGL